MATIDDLFHPVIELPEPVRAARYARLVGLDTVKARLRLEAQLLTNPASLQAWSQHQHGQPLAALTLFADRAPLFVFGGDVGSGKTALAESFGCDLADQLDLPVYLYRLKLTARGSGLVGEMTTLIGDAFAHLLEQGRKARTSKGPNTIYVLVIDEADALTQSRASMNMHHEDRAGVDAVLAGVDSLAGEGVPVLVVLCTNRAQALDPAVARRAAGTFTFDRPNDEEREAVLSAALDGIAVSGRDLTALVKATGGTASGPGFTFSDLTQRLIPSAILSAYPDDPLTAKHVLEAAKTIAPTPEFLEQ